MHRWRKAAEKAVNMTDLYLHALESCRISLPCCFETFKVFFKAGQWIIILNVKLAELLNDHQNKEVEHNVSHDKDEGEEEEWGQRCSTGLPRNAVWWQSHAVIHNSVPVLACRYREQQGEALMEVGEVLPLIDNVTLRHLVEKLIS